MPRLLRTALLCLALTLTGCSLLGDEDPLPPLPAFDVDLHPRPARLPQGTVQFEATVETVEVQRETPYPLTEIVLADSSRTLTISPGEVFPPGELPLREGQRYRFSLTRRPYTWGSAPVLHVSDENGLVLFGATAGERDGLKLPDGWSARLRDGGFETRDVFCGIRAEPLVLEVEHEGKRVSLTQGQSVHLGDYRVHVLVARRVDDSDVHCTDTFTPVVSLVILRGQW